MQRQRFAGHFSGCMQFVLLICPVAWVQLNVQGSVVQLEGQVRCSLRARENALDISSRILPLKVDNLL